MFHVNLFGTMDTLSKRTWLWEDVPTPLVVRLSDYWWMVWKDLANAAAGRVFHDEQHRFQAQTAAAMRADPKLGEHASPDTIEHNRLLIAALTGCSSKSAGA